MTKYKIKKGFITQKLDDKTVIFDGEASVLYTFNETATYIFSKLKLGWEKNKIIEGLIKRYAIKEKKAHTDLKDLLSDLLKKKIITQKTE
jgi:hypothetical protein